VVRVLKGYFVILVSMEASKKICSKCKKEMAIDMFAANSKNECFKQCTRCRLRGRAEQARARMRKKARMDTIEISDCEDDDDDTQSTCSEGGNPLVRLYMNIWSSITK
jgi:hypothetical protein